MPERQAALALWADHIEDLVAGRSNVVPLRRTPKEAKRHDPFDGGPPACSQVRGAQRSTHRVVAHRMAGNSTCRGAG